MTVLLPAIVPVGLIILIGFIAGKTLTLESQTLSGLAIYILSPALQTACTGQHCPKHRGFSYRIRDYLFAALPGGVGDG